MRYTFTFFAILFIFHVGIAQELDEDRVVELSMVNAIRISPTQNISFIQQVGNQNAANIIQSGQFGNLNSIFQTGNSNFFMSSQQGSNISTTSSQSGNNNQGRVTAVGENINITTTQSGNRNIINAYIENLGMMTRSALLEQSGNNNRIDVEFLNNSNLNFGGAEESLRVSQSGTQQELQLRLDNASSPVEITQRPGVGGQGMQVNVVTSSFPLN